MEALDASALKPSLLPKYNPFLYSPFLIGFILPNIALLRFIRAFKQGAFMKNVDIATAYYRGVGKKDVKSVENYLHPDVQVISPLATVNGKTPVLESIKAFSDSLKSLTIRSKFESGDQAVIVYDIDLPAPIGLNRTASLFTINNGLITKIEHFYDSAPFASQKEKFFGKTTKK